VDLLILTLAVTAGAAVASALAALPFAVREPVPVRWLGWASALAAGLMLGLAYVLLAAGLDRPGGALAAGAALGVGFVAAARALVGADAPDVATEPSDGYRLLLESALHAAHEGVAIGAAMALSRPLGLFTAVAVAVHNVPESAALVAALRARGVRLTQAALLASSADANQVLWAVVTLAVAAAAPPVLPYAIGFAVGALVHLVMVELLPVSYREAGRTSIALVTIAAMGVVTLVQSWVP
jgi:ZIP family zinc transporter